jgi:hypothetical protein
MARTRAWLLLACLWAVVPAMAQPSAVPLAAEFAQEVDRQLTVPEAEQQAYAALLAQTLAAQGLATASAQFVLLVDRSPQVQAAMLYWKPSSDAADLPRFVGASPVSTGHPAGYEHFETPLGVFEHVMANPDFRAEGTLNELGIRGYGIKGRRVFDFGWQTAQRGWGARGSSVMRLQLHATDPQVLEPRLGSPQSKGCVRTSGGFNHFLDLHGILDADYEAPLAWGDNLWMLLPQRQATPWSGRYMVVVQTQRSERPAWSPWPKAVRPPARNPVIAANEPPCGADPAAR